ARDIYPHDFLGDSYYITAIKPWDGKAAKDPAIKSLIADGVTLLDKSANDRHKVPYAQVQWETERVALLQQRDAFGLPLHLGIGNLVTVVGRLVEQGNAVGDQRLDRGILGRLAVPRLDCGDIIAVAEEVVRIDIAG